MTREAEVRIPFSGQQWGHLKVRGGSANWTLHETSIREPDLDFMRADFQGLVPSVHVAGASVEVGYSRWTGLCRESHAEVALSPSLPWSIAISGGVSNLRAEFASVRLAEFSVHGGVRDALLELGEPNGRVPIHVHGGVDRLTLVRPHGSAIAVRISGGATEVHLDETFLESVGGGLAWRADGHPRGLFELHISGGVTRLVLATLAPRGIPERSPGDMLALGLPQ